MRDFPACICCLAVVLSIFTGCMLRVTEKRHADYGDMEHIHAIKNSADFIKENIENLNHMYFEEYQPHPYSFIVETETGSTVIQNLIDKELGMRQLACLNLGGLNRNERISKIYNYVLTEYGYVVEPKIWPTMDETIKWKKGDCKGLSLLLMSLLLASDCESHVEISNGHMWVSANVGGAWQILELDRDPGRSRIYRIPGFYDNPLFRIYEDRTEKRVSKRK